MCAEESRDCTDSARRLGSALARQPPRQRSLRGLDAVLRWVFARMSDKKLGTRGSVKEEAACPDKRRGISVILDIFRRADKNGGGGPRPALSVMFHKWFPDDGKLSLDEFRTFFSDGILNEEELESLFHAIDLDKTNHVDTKELCDYFAAHMGDYEEVLACLESLNLFVLKAMDYTQKVYESGTKLDQFVTRFLLKETASQIQSLLTSVESAVDAIDDQSTQTGFYDGMTSRAVVGDWYKQAPAMPMQNKGISRTLNTDRAAISACRGDGLEMQINRLAQLVGLLEDKTVCLDLQRKVMDSGTLTSHLLLVCQHMVTGLGQQLEFGRSLKQYLSDVSAQQECFHATAVRLPDEVTFVLYEFWESEDQWKCHLQREQSKMFQHVKVDALTQPEVVSTMFIPAAWCSLGGK
ncbi:N-terminal EF-hand calcium-binding protein 2 isoform X3 [Narcine bancroftii]|uniref:N-terminal EF-hand calcium-binding protein 2 isoform X3 n=1 Tax=Narcine bancroftii TaxID=1343680 RepID=UPI0038317BCD